MAEKPKSMNRGTDRVGILASVSDRTRLFALLALILEGLFVFATPSLPQDQRFRAFMIATGVLVLALFVVFALELRKPAGHQSVSNPELDSFCHSAAGDWWSFRADTPCPGFVTITPDRAAGTLVMKGRAYDPDGKVVAVWGTLASCIYLKEKKLYYFWRGHHPASPKDTWEGFGEIGFRDSQGLSNSADCLYFDTNLSDVISITRKSSGYWRCTKREADIMHGSDNEGIGALVREKMQIEHSKGI